MEKVREILDRVLVELDLSMKGLTPRECRRVMAALAIELQARNQMVKGK